MQQALVAAAMSRRFDDADDMAQALHAADASYVPLTSGAFQAHLTVVQLGPLTVQRAVDGAHITRGAVAPGQSALILAGRSFTGSTINGADASHRMGSLHAAGSDLHAVCRLPLEWISVSAPTATFEHLADEWCLPAPGAGRFQTLSFTPQLSTRLRDALVAATDFGDRQGQWLLDEHHAGALAGDLHDLLIAASPLVERQRRGRYRATRELLRVVRQAEEFLHANIERPIYSQEICAALQVSERKLHHAFVAACEMSPQAFLKRRRMGMARRALKAAGPDGTLVKSVALAHGFWHLGKFSKEYRDQYGEAPRQTLLGARGG